jgi:putative ABC transport system permease protein
MTGQIPRWRRYLRFVRPNVAADVRDELDFHLEMRVLEYQRRGMDPEEARASALSRFGEVHAISDALMEHDRKKETREQRRELLGDLTQDLRFGWRSLRRAPGFAAAAILTLALGIGANTAIFSVVDALVLRPLPYMKPEQLMSVGSGSAGEFLALRQRLRTFSQLAAFAPRQLSIDDGHEATRLIGAAVTTNLFRLLGVSPIKGRDFIDTEGQPHNDAVIILSYGLWEREFAGAADVIGKRLLVDGSPRTIVGVMPADFHYPSSAAQYWLPIAFDPSNIPATWAVGGGRFIGRVAPGYTMEQAAREIRDVWPALRRLNPLWDPGERYGREVSPQPLQASMVGASPALLWLLVSCVVLVLLIACVNVANLLLARATARERELSVRAALGGGRQRLIRQLMTESILLAVLGGTLGVMLAIVAVKWVVSALPANLPRAGEIGVNGTVLAATAAIVVITGVLFGILPALSATRAARGSGAIGGFRSTRGIRHHRLAGILVSAEVALAVLLVISAQLLVRSFRELRRVELGYRTTHLIAARVSPPSAGYENPTRLTALYTSILGRVSALPGVEQIGATDKMPIATSVWGFAARIEGQFEDATRSLPDIHHLQAVTPGYFATLGIPSLRGRLLDDDDVAGSTPVAVVSQSMAKRFWPNGDAIGKRVGYPWASPWITIVGVVPDVKQDSLRDTLRISMYIPWQQRVRMSGGEMWVVARTTTDPGAVATAIRDIVRDADRTVPVSDIRTMDEILAGSMKRERFTTAIVGAFAIAALLLGAVGIYGVMSYLVSQRAREMGVRLALGASPGSVLGLVVARGAWLAALGAAAGVVIAMWATKPLRVLLYDVSATDPLTFITVPALFMIVAVVASYAPARRATRVDPTTALRGD